MKEMLEKCGLYALSFSLLLAVFYAPFSASAVSDYDSFYRTTSNLIIEASIPGFRECDPLDISTLWSSYILAEPESSMAQSFQTALDGDGRWGVTQVVSSDDDYPNSYVIVYWTEDNSLKMDWNGMGYNKAMEAIGLMGSNVHMANIMCGTSGVNSYDVTYEGSSPGWGQGHFVSDSSNQIDDGTTQGYLNFFFYGDTNLPSNYEGTPIRGESVLPGDKEELEPEYTWSVSKSGKLRIKYVDSLPHFLTGTSFINVNKMKNHWDGLDSPVGDTLTVQPAGWLDETISLPGEGYYMFDVSHDQQLDSPPWESDAQDKYIIKQRFVQIKWDGKSDISGTTVGCTGNELCNDFRDEDDGTLYEDCSVYGTDLLGGFGCVIRNFGVFLGELLKSLFVPSSTQMTQFANDFRTLLNQKLGFVWYPFDWLINLFTAFQQAESSCTISTSGIPGANQNATFFGKPVNLSVCSAEHDFPKIYNIVVFFVRLVTVFGLVYALFGKWQSLMERPEISNYTGGGK